MSGIFQRQNQLPGRFELPWHNLSTARRKATVREYLKKVPLYASVGHLSVDAADQMVASGVAHSLRGKAVLILDQTILEKCLSEMDVDPDTIATILRAAARVESEKIAKAVEAQGAEVA